MSSYVINSRFVKVPIFFFSLELKSWYFYRIKIHFISSIRVSHSLSICNCNHFTIPTRTYSFTEAIEHMEQNFCIRDQDLVEAYTLARNTKQLEQKFFALQNR